MVAMNNHWNISTVNGKNYFWNLTPVLLQNINFLLMKSFYITVKLEVKDLQQQQLQWIHGVKIYKTPLSDSAK